MGSVPTNIMIWTGNTNAEKQQREWDYSFEHTP